MSCIWLKKQVSSLSRESLQEHSFGLQQSKGRKLQLIYCVHTVSICTQARGRPCLSHGSEALVFLTQPCHECSFIQGYTISPHLTYFISYMSLIQLDIFFCTVLCSIRDPSEMRKNTNHHSLWPESSCSKTGKKSQKLVRSSVGSPLHAFLRTSCNGLIARVNTLCLREVLNCKSCIAETNECN